MVFSSVLFLFGFLPLVLIATFLLPGTRLRNVLLLMASLFFYAWAEGLLTALLLGSSLANYGFGLWIERSRRPRRVVGLAVAANLGGLVVFKYLNFFVDNLNGVLGALGIAAIEFTPIHLPIGISFFTFQALTYVVDVHRGSAPAQRNPLHVALYISLFPQLIAGPIVRYAQIARQLGERVVTSRDFAVGVRRFVIGLGKKVLLADTLAVPADAVFSLPAGDLHFAMAWLGVTCFTLQIYFDFSGYSDMAIGLGRMFGFRFPENFEHPYASRSLREFWRRWHITLSTWFRDYLYLPLGGNRVSRPREFLNLIAVFFLCGLWHGASWTFVVWGLLHGMVLLLERSGGEALLARAWAPIRHGLLLGVVMVGWAFFRSETLDQAMTFLGAMAGLGVPAAGLMPAASLLDPLVGLALAAGALGATPIPRNAARGLAASLGVGRVGSVQRGLLSAIELAALFAVLLGSAMTLVAGTNNPFIYFRF